MDLRQSTTITVKIGPFLDKTDGVTEEVALAGSMTVYVEKNGGTYAARSSATAITHDTGLSGNYAVELNTTDTGTLGRLKVAVQDSATHLPVWHEYNVITQQLWDSKYSTDKLEVDVVQIGGDTQSATDLKDFADAGYDPATNKVEGVKLADATTDVTNEVSADVTAIDGLAAAAQSLRDIFDGSGAVMTLDQLKIVNSSGPGIEVWSYATDTPAVDLHGNGTAPGLRSKGGLTGPGVEMLGGNTSGFGLRIASTDSATAAINIDGGISVGTSYRAALSLYTGSSTSDPTIKIATHPSSGNHAIGITANGRGIDIDTDGDGIHVDSAAIGMFLLGITKDLSATLDLADSIGAFAVGAFANHPDVDLNADQSGITIGTVNSIAAGGITAASFAAGAIDAAAIATDAIGSAELATSAVNEIRDSILADSTPFNGADIATILVDTGTTIPALIGTPVADLATDIAGVQSTVDDIETDTQDIQSRLPAALVGGRIDSDVQAVSGDTTAADNIEATYDGTGYSDPVAPAQQQQVDTIVNTGAATNKPASSFTLTAGVQASGTYADTEALDGTYHQLQDSAGTLDCYYETNVGSTGVPISIRWTGRVNGNGDNLIAYAWKWSTASWQQIGTVTGKATAIDDPYSFDLLTSHVGTGADAGKVRIRFYGTGLTTANLYVDQFFISYSTVASPVGYANGAVWLDTINGTAGAIADVNGVADFPTNNIADAITIAVAKGLNRIEVANGSSITFVATMDNYSLVGVEWTLALGGQSISSAHIFGATVSGTATGSNARFMDCRIMTATLSACGMGRCALAGTITLSDASTYLLEGCFSAVAGTSAPVIDFGAAIGDTNLNMRHYSGGIEIENIGQAGTDNMSLEGDGQLILNANCAGGTIAIRGNFKITDNASAVVTLSEKGNISSVQGKTYAAASYDRTVDSNEAIADAVAVSGDWNTTEREMIRDALGVTGTKTTAIGGQLQTIDSNVDTILVDTGTTIPALIGTPIADLATDIAGIQSTANDIETDTQDIQSKIGTPVVDVSTDIAGVQSTTDDIETDTQDIQSKIGTPVADVSTDIAAVKTVVDANNTDLSIITGVDGVTLATAQALYAPSKAGDEMDLVDDAITASKHDESTSFPIASVDSGSTQIARTGADADTLETLSDQVDGVQTSVDGIQNNTRFVATVPTSMLIPDTGDTMYKLGVHFYDTDGNMEDPENNEIDILYEDVSGADKDAFYDDAAGTTPATAGVIDTNMWKMVKISTGVYETYYKLPSTESVEQWTASFKLDDPTTSNTLQYARSTNVVEENPGNVTLADNATNKGVVAEGVLATPANKLATDASGRVDVSLIEGTDATDQLEAGAAAGILAIPANKLVTDGSGRIDVGDWAGTAVGVGGSSGLPAVDAQAISDSTVAADNVEANIGNLDAAITTRASSTALSTHDSKLDVVDGKVDVVDGNVDLILADTADMQPKLGTPAGADMSADIAAVKSTADDIETDTQDIQTNIGTPVADVSTDIAVIKSAVDVVDGNVDLVLADTADMQPKLGTPAGADMSADIAAVKSTADDIETDTQDLQSNVGAPVALDGGSATLGSMLTKMADDNGGADYDATTDSLHESGAVADWSAGEKENIRDALGVDGTKTAATGGQLQGIETKIDTVDGNVDDIETKLGTPVALDGGAATVGSMLTKIADDNGGVDYDAATDSLHEQQETEGDWTAGEKEQLRSALGIDGTKTAATSGQLQSIQNDVTGIETDLADGTYGLAAIRTTVDSVQSTVDDVETDTQDIQVKIGTPANIDGGGASIAENLKKFADDNGGTTFDATLHSLQAIREAMFNLSSNEEAQMKGALGMDDSGTTPAGGELQTMHTVIDAIKTVTDLIPDAGAMTSIAQEATLGTPVADIATDIGTVLTAVNGVRTEIDDATYGLSALRVAIDNIDADMLAQIVDGSATVKIALTKILAFCANKISRVGTVYTYRNYDDTADEMVLTGTSGGRTRA